MHEQDKLDEAQHFLARMGQSPEPKTFRFELSAFLSAARSALQYALEEARSKSGGQAWYDAQVSANAVVKFFKDKRDISIHRQPVVPTTSASETVTETLGFSEAVHLQVINPEGKIIQDVSVGVQPSASPPLPQLAVVTYSYSFADWSGPEDVLTLSRRYLAEAQAIVNDGVAKGYLSR